MNPNHLNAGFTGFCLIVTLFLEGASASNNSPTGEARLSNTAAATLADNSYFEEHPTRTGAGVSFASRDFLTRSISVQAKREFC